ncbi:MAG: transposase [Candidatus Hydrothermae bacterium]|nr:transposase [Candidatus Hydrothermae bacterium]
MEGKKEVLYVGIEMGRENAQEWARIFRLLIERGLRKPLMFITDDLPGLDKVLEELFPEADHQLCLNHLMRNLRINLPKEHAEKVIRFIKAARFRPDDKEKIIKDFQDLLSSLDLSHPADISYVQRLINKAHNFFAFLDYPHEIHKHIYTTNPIEAIFKNVKIQERANRGFFSSKTQAFRSFAIVLDNLSLNAWKRPLPAFKHVSYYLRQTAALKYPTHF